MKRIKVHIFGGLGNQLFQYWMGYEISRINNVEVVFDASDISRRGTSRSLDLKEFELIDFLKIETSNKNLLLRLSHQLRDILSLRSRFVRKLFADLNIYYFATEIGFDRNVEFYSSFREVRGNFQSFEYLQNSKQQIFKGMNLKNPSKKFIELSDRMEELQPIVLHVRGGDYRELKGTFGMLDTEYFLRAIRIAQEREGIGKIWLFTDDDSRAEQLLKNLELEIDCVISKNNEVSDAEAMKLISCGKAIIISNSTYSWWGAWLSSATTVIAPERWFKGIQDPCRIYPPDWVTLQSSWL